MSPDMDWGCTSTFVLRLLAAQCERLPVFVPGIALLYHIWAPKGRATEGVYMSISSKRGRAVYIQRKRWCLPNSGPVKMFLQKATEDWLCSLVANKESQSSWKENNKKLFFSNCY